LAESASYDYLTETEQRLLSSVTFCEILWIKSEFVRLSARKMAENAQKPGFWQNFYEVLKNLAESIRNFGRKAGTFSIFGGGKPPLPPPPNR
jgi:hypothetical protein